MYSVTDPNLEFCMRIIIMITLSTSHLDKHVLRTFPCQALYRVMVLAFTFNTIIFLELTCIWYGDMPTSLFSIAACFPHPAFLILLTLVYFLFYLYHLSSRIL